MKNIPIILLLILLQNLPAQENITFDLTLLNGNEIKINEIYEQGPTLINFWALWCKPCRAEMKELNKLFNKYSDMGFNIVGINLDSPRSSAKVESFIRTLGIEYHVALDPNKQIFESLNGQVVPLNLLYNTEGKLIYRHTGYLPGDEYKLEKEIKKLVEPANE